MHDPVAAAVARIFGSGRLERSCVEVSSRIDCLVLNFDASSLCL